MRSTVRVHRVRDAAQISAAIETLQQLSRDRGPVLLIVHDLLPTHLAPDHWAPEISHLLDAVERYTRLLRSLNHVLVWVSQRAVDAPDAVFNAPRTRVLLAPEYQGDPHTREQMPAHDTASLPSAYGEHAGSGSAWISLRGRPSRAATLR